MHGGTERAVPASHGYTTQRGRQTLAVVPAKTTNYLEATSTQNILQKLRPKTVTIGTMANLNGGNNRQGLKNVAAHPQTSSVHVHLPQITGITQQHPVLPVSTPTNLTVHVYLPQITGITQQHPVLPVSTPTDLTVHVYLPQITSITQQHPVLPVSTPTDLTVCVHLPQITSITQQHPVLPVSTPTDLTVSIVPLLDLLISQLSVFYRNLEINEQRFTSCIQQVDLLFCKA